MLLRRRWRIGLVIPMVALASAALLLSCGGQHGQSAKGDVALPGSGATFPSLEITQATLATLKLTASDFEWSLISDGELTFAEYESAVLSTVKCFADNGIEITPYPHNHEMGQPGPLHMNKRGRYEYLPFLTQDNYEQKVKVATTCQATYSATIEPLWAEHAVPTQAEMQGARDEIANCLRSSGREVPDHPGSQELLAIAFPPDGIPKPGFPEPVYRACAEQTATDYDMEGFMG